MLSDDDLVEQILLGNENAAEELIKRYYTSILRYCRWHCSNLEKAEDLTQETFLKLFKNLSGYKGKKKFKAYVYTIANHLCIDESRKVEFSPLEDEENIVHEYNDIVRLEDRAEISYFLNFLSSEQREAVILRFGEQLSFGEIAKVMGCNMRTAQSRVRNALKIMRKEQENETHQHRVWQHGISQPARGHRQPRVGPHQAHHPGGKGEGRPHRRHLW